MRDIDLNALLKSIATEGSVYDLSPLSCIKMPVKFTKRLPKTNPRASKINMPLSIFHGHIERMVCKWDPCYKLACAIGVHYDCTVAY
jgi:hypothetical protein